MQKKKEIIFVCALFQPYAKAFFELIDPNKKGKIDVKAWETLWAAFDLEDECMEHISVSVDDGVYPEVARSTLRGQFLAILAVTNRVQSGNFSEG